MRRGGPIAIARRMTGAFPDAFRNISQATLAAIARGSATQSAPAPAQPDSRDPRWRVA
jgi:hypothetical protein